MNFEVYAIQSQAEVVKVQDEIEKTYDQYGDTTLFWCFIDLSNSSNYRLLYGPKKGYIRSEMFFSLVSSVISYEPEIVKIKEIGDEVLLSSREIRPIFESLMIIDHVSNNLSDYLGSERYPFSIHAAIGFGVTKKLNRRNNDYVGSTIDQLARIMSVRSDNSNILISQDAFIPTKEIIEEYPFVLLSESKIVPKDISKNMIKEVFYKELLIDYEARRKYSDNFVRFKGKVIRQY